MERGQLQKESAARLNEMMDELRNAPSADLAAKNLGEEGCAYIAEALAFNDRSAFLERGAITMLSPMKMHYFTSDAGPST